MDALGFSPPTVSCHPAPSQTCFSAHGTSQPVWDFSGVSFHLLLAATSRRSWKTPLQAQKQDAPAQLQGDAWDAPWPQIRIASQPPVPTATHQPFVSQLIRGCALCFIAINIQKTHGKETISSQLNHRIPPTPFNTTLSHSAKYSHLKPPAELQWDLLSF